jgi:acyl-CoA thioesterase-2
MTSASSSLERMLEVFDVRAVGEGTFVGTNDYGERDIVDASQVLSQAIVAASKSVDGKCVRRASAPVPS